MAPDHPHIEDRSNGWEDVAATFMAVRSRTGVAGLKPVQAANSVTSAKVAGTSPSCSGMKFFNAGLSRACSIDSMKSISLTGSLLPMLNTR